MLQEHPFHSYIAPFMKFIHRKKLVGLLILAGALWSLLGLFSNTREVTVSISHLSLPRMALVLALSLSNYVIRAIRFHRFSRIVAVRPIERKTNTVIFFSGLSMNLTPARVGEVVKAYFQHRLFGESFARMAPIVFFERLTDGLAMLILMSIGVLAFGIGIGAFVLLVAVASTIVALLHWHTAGLAVVGWIRRFPLGKQAAKPLERALSSSYELTRIQNVGIGTLLGVAAWALEASGLWLLVVALGVPLSLSSLYLVWFVFSVSAAAGFLSIFPGGLGINELSTIGLLDQLFKMPYADALVATFAFRLVTLWMGIVLGVVSLVYLERKVES